MQKKIFLLLLCVIFTAVLMVNNIYADDQIQILYKCAETSSTTNTISPWFKVFNNGTTTLALSRVKIRYWYTRDTDIPQTYVCDWAQVGKDNVTGQFVTGISGSNADSYLEIGFTAGAGSLAPGNDSGKIQLRFHKTDWSTYNQSNDYSFNAAMTSYTLNTNITAYIDGMLVFGTEPVISAIQNSDFETGSGYPSYWSINQWENPTAYFTWPYNEGINGSKCVKIQADSFGDCSWYQTIQLTPGAAYTVKGFIKGENVETQGDEGANISVLGTWEGTWRHEDTLGTFDWKEAALTFQAPENGMVDIACRLGHWFNPARGTVWFDNLSIYELTRSEGAYVYLDLENDDLARITPENLIRWRNHLDAVYSVLLDLIGTAPYDGAKIGIMSTQQFPGGWAIAGNPIRWWKEFIDDTLAYMNDYDDWSWGIMHELGHDFDWDYWNFHGEFFASFKAAYVIDVLNGRVYFEDDGQKIWYVGPQIRQRFYSDNNDCYLNTIAQGKYRNDALIYCWFRISDVVGWQPFKQTFRYFMQSQETPETNVDKFNKFMDKLTEYAGYNVRSTFLPGELDTIINGLIWPTTPENLTAEVQGSTVSLTWNASTDNVAVDYYRVYRRAGGHEMLVGTTEGTNFVDDTVESGVTYTYWVTAVDTVDVESGGSERISVTP